MPRDQLLASSFLELAEQLGYARTHVVPVRNWDTHLGAPRLFETRSRDLDDEDLPVLRSLVGVATIGLLHERTLRRRELVATALQAALTQRLVMEQALWSRGGTGGHRARDGLRPHARLPAAAPDPARGGRAARPRPHAAPRRDAAGP